MKIVFLSDDFPPESFGGAGISTYELARGLYDAGHDVYVISACQDKNKVGEELYDRLRVFKIFSNYNGRWRSYLSLYNIQTVSKVKCLLKEIKPDVVHVNNIHYHLSYHCLYLAKCYSKVVVFTARDVMSFSFDQLCTKKYLKNFNTRLTWIDHIRQAKKRFNPIRNFVIRRYLKCAGKVVAVSEAMKIALEQNKISDVKVIYTGLNIKKWQVNSKKLVQFKQKHELENKKIIFLGGRLTRAKGFNQALLVISRLNKLLPDTKILIAGTADGSTLENVISLGWLSREEIKYAIASANLVLIPSIIFDALPRLALEGSVVAKPVIASFYGGAKEVVQNRVTGYVLDPFNINDMVNKIFNLLNDPKKADSFGVAGRKTIMAKFNIKNKVDQYISLYQGLNKDR